MIRILVCAAVFSSLVFGFDFEVFPKADKNSKIQVIELKPLKNEKNYKIEVVFGKTLEVDCNHHFFTGGKLVRKNLKGYGYAYYEFTNDKSNLASTMMLCETNKKSKKFIKFGENLNLYYNSTTPTIIYTPKDIEVKYKVFKFVEEKEAVSLKN